MLIRLVQTIVLVFLGTLYLATLLQGMALPASTDFAKFYGAAELLRAGVDPNTPLPVDWFGPLPTGAEASRQMLHPNLNLPIVTALFVPFTWLEVGTALAAWSGFSVVCGLAAILLLGRELRVSSGQRIGATWLVILLLSYYPTLVGFRFGQVALPLFLLATLAWAGARQGRLALAGAALGLAVLLKPFMLAPVAFLLFVGRWRVAAWALGVVAFGLLLGVALLGLDVHLAYVEVVRRIDWYSSNWNASLLGLFSRVLGAAPRWSGAAGTSEVAKLLAAAVGLALMGQLLVWAGRFGRCASRQAFDLGFGLMLVLMLLSAPLGWMYYFPLLFITFFGAASVLPHRHGAGARGRADGWARLGLLLAFGLSTAAMPLIPAAALDGPRGLAPWAGTYCYALLLLAVTQHVLLRRAHVSRGSVPWSTAAEGVS